jgi:hypothetical protein
MNHKYYSRALISYRNKLLNCGELCFTYWILITYWPKHVIIGHVVYNLGFAFLCTTSDNQLMKKQIIWKLSSIWMKILNDMTWTLDWIEAYSNSIQNQLKRNEIQIGGECIENLLVNMVLNFIFKTLIIKKSQKLNSKFFTWE